VTVRAPAGAPLLHREARTPWAVSVTVFWQGSSGPFRPEALVSVDGNRWNEPGVPTVYFAGDLGLALIEAGRHLAPDDQAEPRALWSAKVETDGIVDIRGGPGTNDIDEAHRLWFLDSARTRQVAESMRTIDGMSGLLVPSAGSPDDLSRANLVLYVDRLARPLGSIVLDPRVIGRIEVGS